MSIAIYLRVSSKSQRTESQKPDLTKWAANQTDEVRWYSDKFTGKTMDRPGWNQLEADKGLVEVAIASAPMALAWGVNWATGLSKAAVAGSAFAQTMTTITAGAGLVGLAAAGGFLIGEEIDRASEKWRAALDAAAQHEMEQFRTAEAARLSAISATNAKRVSEALRANEGVGRTYTAELAVVKSEGDAVEHEITQRLSRQASAYQKYADAIVRAEEKSQSEIAASRLRAERLTDEKNDLRFRQSMEGKTGDEQVKGLTGQGMRTAQEADAMLRQGARTGDEKTIARAQQVFASADAYEREAAAQAKSLGLIDNAKTAEALRLKIIDDHLAAEAALTAAEQKRMALLTVQRNAEQARADKAKEYAQVVVENSKIRDSQGNLKPQDELNRMATARQEAYAGLSKISFGGSDEQIAKLLGLSKDLQSVMAQQPQDLRLSVEKSLADVKGKIDQAFASYRAKLTIDVGGLSKLTGMPIQTQQGMIGGETAIRAEYDRLLAAQSKAKDEAAKSIAVARTELQALATDGSSAWQTVLLHINETPPAIKALDSAIVKVRSDFIETASSTNVTVDAMKRIADEVRLLDEYSHQGLTGNAGLKLFVADAAKMLEALQRIRDLQNEMQNSEALAPAATERINAIKAWLDALPTAKLDDVTAATNQAADAAERLGRAFGDASRTIGALPVPQTPDAQNKAFGGSIYFAAGGSPRGTDTVPAMLSPGEVVVNASSARKFSGELQAMNAGVAPVYHSHGTTTTIGDVNVGPVTINSTSGAQSARTIANGIRRELRRGSTTLD